MKIVPARGRIILKRQDEVTKTSGGIYIPSTGDGKKKYLAEVISVGEGITFWKEGDIACFDTFTGSKVEYNGEQLLVTTQDDLLFKVVEE